MPKPIIVDGVGVTPGKNVDRINVGAGITEAIACGFTEPNMIMTVDYCLSRWAKGEEDHAQRTALSNGIDLTSWYRILAAARAAGEQHAKIYADLDEVIQDTMKPSPDEDYTDALHQLVDTIIRNRR